jgi:hypothetical protein
VCVQKAIKDRFNFTEGIADMKNISSTLFTLLIIRDPIERLISSFKNKYACDNEAFFIDKHDRERFVPELLGLHDKKLHELRNNPMFNLSHYKERCLSFGQFLTALNDIHSNPAKIPRLNPHIVPQDLGCIRKSLEERIDVSNVWKAIGAISTNIIYRKFFEHLISHGLERNSSDFVGPQKEHSSAKMKNSSEELLPTKK